MKITYDPWRGGIKHKGSKHKKRIPNTGTAASSKYQKFWCTVCKMKTWTYHRHGGRNTSETIRHVTSPSDITDNM